MVSHEKDIIHFSSVTLTSYNLFRLKTHLQKNNVVMGALSDIFFSHLSI